MKKLNVLLISLFFTSLLAGCGIRGPLYSSPVTKKIEKVLTTPKTEQGNRRFNHK